MNRFMQVVVVSTGVFFSQSGLAAHPLITDDTGTQGRGKSQIEANAEYAYDKEQISGITVKATGTDAAMFLSYGVIDTADLVVGVPYQWHREKRDGAITARDSGISDISLDLKWRFFDDKNLSMALKPGISIPVGDEDKGLGAGKTAYGSYLIITSSHDSWSHHFNLGYIRKENKHDERESVWHLSLATEYSLSEKIRIAANIGTETNPDKSSDREPAFGLLGLIYSPQQNMDISGGVKVGLNDVETDLSVLAGATLRL